MKVIIVKQPFASLIALGYKEYEFRTWKTKYRGEILIHAGKGVDKEAMKRFSYLNLEYPSGCIIAKAIISDCIYVDDHLKTILRKKDKNVYHGVLKENSSWDGYGFKLEHVELIDPIYVNGKLGLWNYDNI